MSARQVKLKLRQQADPEKANVLKRFFKTGPGQYGEGDHFIGVTVPKIRQVIKEYYELDLSEIEKLISSKFHEERLAAVLILVQQYKLGYEEEVYKFYIKNLAFVNNWDLIDSSAHKIIGPYLEDRSKGQLIKWAKSKDLWQRRIAIMSTFHYIKNDEYQETLKIAKMLLQDPHDLIHKAVGWMLREIGKRNLKVEEGFLQQHYKKMPRTMLRYAIERFPEKKRKAYLNGTV